jgi:hypothetical protein
MTFQTASYRVSALPDPATLLRILELFALRDIVPQRVKCRQIGDRLLAEIDVCELGDREGALIADKMRAIVLVQSVTYQQVALRQAA